MAIFEYKNMKINYLIEGSGKPILLLNGIMMTTLSWEPVASPLRQNNTLIRLDLLDQGQSEKQTTDYTINDQADLVYEFIKFLKYDKINIVGISYGGYVGLNLASRYPKIVDRIIIFNSSANVDERDKEMFKQFIHSANSNDPYAFYLTTIPLFYSPSFYEENNDWIKQRESLLVKFFENKDYLMTIKRLAKSCLTHDVRNDLKHIIADTLIVNGDEDYLIPIARQKYLHYNIKNSKLVSMGKTGHVSPYENPILFTSLVYGYINNPTFEFNI